MEQGAVRKLMRTVAAAALVLGTAVGVAGLGALVASPAIAAPNDHGGTFTDPGNGSNPGSGSTPGTGGGTPSDPVSSLLGGITGGSKP
jgi:hypothetical protein